MLDLLDWVHDLTDLTPGDPVGNDIPALTDPDIEPTEELIADALGPTMPAWRELTAAITGEQFGLRIQWMMYADHPAWLAKVLRSAKNLAWLSAWVGHGRITVYFAERHREQLLALDIDNGLRKQIATEPMVGRTLPVPIDIYTSGHVHDALEVLRLKKTAK